MSLTHLLAIGAGGFVGAIARFGGVRLVHQWAGDAFPFGTILVNVVGCLALGWLVGYAEQRPLDAHLRAGLMVGLCGGFTTMSAFSLDTLALLQRGAFGLALANVGLTVVVCLMALWLGLLLARGA